MATSLTMVDALITCAGLLALIEGGALVYAVYTKRLRVKRKTKLLRRVKNVKS